MSDLCGELLARPSRLVGWVVVVVVHLLMWQVLIHGLDVFRFAPASKAVEVTFLEQESPPPVQPLQPKLPSVDVAVVTDLYLPTPEVKVTRDSPPLMMATSIMPVTRMPDPVPTAADAIQSTRLLVVSDSEVDYLVRPEIRYPLAAKRAREQGTVLLSVIVDERGVVRRISIHRSSGHHRLDEVALRAIRALRVKPYIRNGRPLSVEIRVPVEFSLSTAV